MKFLPLGDSGLTVSEYCLGTMTWGNQTSEADGHAQIDRALDRGITFLDTAEMYPTNPVRAETVGATEAVIGSWLAKTGRRADMVLATKIAGPNSNFACFDRPVTAATLGQALEGSLKRLQTDYVDLYQVHWPNRGSYHFRQIWSFDPSGQPTAQTLDNMAEVMEALKGLVKQGKIRAFGLSNETVWGTLKWLDAAKATGGPRVASMQNEYSLLCRQHDSDHAEMGVHENITLLAYSPLAAGLLTGKYQNNVIPANSRMALTPALGGRKAARAFEAVAAFHAVAERHGIDPVHMALAWTRSRPFATIPIIGATTLAQLDRELDAVDLTLDAAVLDDLAAAHKAHPMPY